MLFRLKKNKNIKNREWRDIRTLYGSDKEDHYKPIRTGNVFSSKYIEHESNGDKDKSLSIEKYLDKVRSYLSDAINDHISQGE